MARGILRTVLAFALLFALTGSDAARSAPDTTQTLHTILQLKQQSWCNDDTHRPRCYTRLDGPSYGPDLKGMKYHSQYDSGCPFIPCPEADYWFIGAKGEPDWLYGNFCESDGIPGGPWRCGSFCGDPLLRETQIFFLKPCRGGLFDFLEYLPPGEADRRTFTSYLRIGRGTGIFAGATGTGTLDCLWEKPDVTAYRYACLLTLAVRVP